MSFLRLVQTVATHAKILHGIELALIAREYGVQVPESLFSNDIAELRMFNDYYPEVIVKGGSGYKSKCCMFQIEEVEQYFRLHGWVPPLLIQERIIGPDIRAHVVGCKHVIAEMTVSRDADYRFSSKKLSEHIKLPDEISELCIELCKLRSLDLVGIDFRLNKNGNWFLLEINSMPDFYGYDVRSRYAITDALLEFLHAR